MASDLDSTDRVWTGVLTGISDNNEFVTFNRYLTLPQTEQSHISCDNWTSSSSTNFAKVGDPTQFDFKWANTNGFGGNSDAACDIARRFYCISQ